MTVPLSVAPFVKHGSPVLGVRRLKYVTHCRPSNSDCTHTKDRVTRFRSVLDKVGTLRKSELDTLVAKL
jgi:hypothetical protein